MKGNRKGYLIFTIFIFAFCLLFVIVESINSKLFTSDFEVYFGAVNDFFSGGNPYDKSYGLDTGFFKYPPFTLYLFSFYALLPFKIAQGLHLLILMCSLVFSLLIWHNLLFNKFLKSARIKSSWILYLGFLFIVLHIIRELHLGNVNLILLGLFSAGSYYFSKNKLFQTVLFFSCMVILKPITIFIFIPLLVYGQWRIIIGSGILGLVFFLFPILHAGMTNSMELWYNWFKAISAHGDYIISENSSTYLANLYLGLTSQWLTSIILSLLLIGLLILDRLKYDKSGEGILFWLTVFLSFTPSFFVTDTEHFLLSLPLIMGYLFFIRSHFSLLKLIFLIAVFLLMSINSNDLLGREFSDNLDRHGILGLGNLLLIGSFVFFHFKANRQLNSSIETPSKD